jgi:hypothetical protein
VNIAPSRSSIRYSAAALAGTTVTARSGQTECPRRRLLTVAAVSALALAAGIAGCGGSSDNGVAAKSPDAIVAAATNAVQSIKSVHVVGSGVSAGAPLAFDLNLAAGKGGSGQISENGLDFRMIVINQEVYIDGSDAFWRHAGAGAAAVQLFHGKWLKGPVTGPFAGIVVLADPQKLFNMFLSSHGKLAKGGTSTVDGQKVIAVNDTTQGGTLYVATTGKPYPVEVAKTGAGGGHVIFDRYNQPVSVSAPPNSIDITELQAAATPSTATSTTSTSSATPTQAQSTTQRTPDPTAVALGAKSFAPGGDGFGTVQPSDIFNGGDPSGHISQIHWTGWGSNTAFGTGMSSIFKPSGGYYPQPVQIQLRADQLAGCAPGAPPVYRHLSVREPSVPGGPLGPWMGWSGPGNICSAP